MINQQRNSHSANGFIALVALLIVAAAGLTIGLAATLASLDELQAALAGSQAVQARMLARSCAEDGLEYLRRNWSNYTQTLSSNDNSCIIEAMVSGPTAELNATGTVASYNQRIKIQVDNQLEVINWQEE